MKTESEHRLLLDDVLAEAAPADFERALRDGTLCAVRRRRRMHHWSRGLAVVGVFGAMALVVWRTLLPGTAGQSDSACAAHGEFATVAAIHDHHDETRQRSCRRLVAEDVCAGRNRFDHGPVQGDRRRATAGTGGGPSGGPGATRPESGRAALSEPGGHQRVSCAVGETGAHSTCSQPRCRRAGGRQRKERFPVRFSLSRVL